MIWFIFVHPFNPVQPDFPPQHLDDPFDYFYQSILLSALNEKLYEER